LRTNSRSTRGGATTSGTAGLSVHDVWMSMTSASPASATLTVVIQARPDFGSVLAIDRFQLALPASPTTDNACPGAEDSDLLSISTVDPTSRGHFALTHPQTSNCARRRLAEECAGHRSDARTTRRTPGVLDLKGDGSFIARSSSACPVRTHGSSPVHAAARPRAGAGPVDPQADPFVVAVDGCN
jgi:hypothetical protein